jgi:hypothetical protein
MNDHKTQSIFHKNEEGEVIEIDASHPDFSMYISITPQDYAKERKYQELLLKSCDRWR